MRWRGAALQGICRASQAHLRRSLYSTDASNSAFELVLRSGVVGAWEDMDAVRFSRVSAVRGSIIRTFSRVSNPNSKR